MGGLCRSRRRSWCRWAGRVDFVLLYGVWFVIVVVIFGSFYYIDASINFCL